MVQLENIAKELTRWTHGKGLILQADGDIFCSGGDLSIGEIPEVGLLMSTFMHKTLTQLYCLPFVTVCLVHGKAIGGGAELTTLTDYRVFTDSGEVCFVQGRMGLVTGWGGGTRLVKLLGPTKAIEILTTCKKLKGKEALETSLANHIIGTENRFEETKAWLMERTLHEPQVIQAMKKIVVGARDLSYEESLLNERTNFSPLWEGPANVTALNQNIKHK